MGAAEERRPPLYRSRQGERGGGRPRETEFLNLPYGLRSAVFGDDLGLYGEAVLFVDPHPDGSDYRVGQFDAFHLEAIQSLPAHGLHGRLMLSAWSPFASANQIRDIDRTASSSMPLRVLPSSLVPMSRASSLKQPHWNPPNA